MQTYILFHIFCVHSLIISKLIFLWSASEQLEKMTSFSFCCIFFKEYQLTKDRNCNENLSLKHHGFFLAKDIKTGISKHSFCIPLWNEEWVLKTIDSKWKIYMYKWNTSTQTFCSSIHQRYCFSFYGSVQQQQNKHIQSYPNECMPAY